MSSSRTTRVTGEGDGQTDRGSVAAGSGPAAVTAAGDDPETVTVNGRTVAYAAYGDPGGVPVVFCHGTPGSRLLGAVAADAAREQGVRLLAVDRPGYGRSDPWPDRTLADAGAFVAPVLDDAGVDRAGVVGFSGGGPHALALAATRPDLVRSVALVGSATPPDCVDDRPRTQRVLSTMARRTPRLLGGLLRAQAWIARRTSPSVVVSQYTADPGAVPDEAATLVRRDFCEAVARSRAGVVRESRLTASEWGVSLAVVSRPVALWHGGADANVPVAAARRLADRLPDADLTVVEAADHLHSLLAAHGAALRFASGA